MFRWTIIVVFFFMACSNNTNLPTNNTPTQKEALYQNLKANVDKLGIDGTALENAILRNNKTSARTIIEDLLDESPITMTQAEITQFFNDQPAGITAFATKVGDTLLNPARHPISSFTNSLNLIQANRITVMTELLDSATAKPTRDSHLRLVQSAIQSHTGNNDPARFSTLINLLTIAELMDPLQ